MSNSRILAIGLSVMLVIGCSRISVESASYPSLGEGEDIAEERGIGGSGRRDYDEANSHQENIQVLGLVDERGIGGSGRRDLLDSDTIKSNQDSIQALELVDERGIGGSGRRLQWLAQLQGNKKIGVLGTIDAFGSIWVNGLRIHYSADTPLTIDGQSISSQQLRLGQRAVLTAQRHNGLLIADQIEVIHAVVGPVSAVDIVGEQFTILGQKVKLHSTTLKNLAGGALPLVGDWLQVAGVRDAQQNILASAISDASTADRIEGKVLIRGQLVSTQTGFRIGGKRLTLPSHSFTDKDFVVLRAQLSSTSAVDTLTEVRTEAILSLMSRPDVELISIERSTDNQARRGPYGPSTKATQQPHSKLQVIDIQRQGKKNVVKSQGIPEFEYKSLKNASSVNRRAVQVEHTTKPRVGVSSKDIRNKVSDKSAPATTKGQTSPSGRAADQDGQGGRDGRDGRGGRR
jgi:hypothetical protein